ncbi:hypothetical protein CRG98_029299 [Punica granatum]|uniref:Uncharacterized protein n=1 Tax=Punica granatum TaxID=22663 RepID=A0A2I0J3C6_PUNGR|nr:hypothetical protein CRG98_029299 [Punica granatum]
MARGLVELSSNCLISFHTLESESSSAWILLGLRQMTQGAGARAGGKTVRPRLPTLRHERRDLDGAVELPEAQGQFAKLWMSRAWHCVKRLMDYRGDWMNERHEGIPDDDGYHHCNHHLPGRDYAPRWCVATGHRRRLGQFLQQ